MPCIFAAQNSIFVPANECQQKMMENYIFEDIFEKKIPEFENPHVNGVIKSRSNRLIFKERKVVHVC